MNIFPRLYKVNCPICIKRYISKLAMMAKMNLKELEILFEPLAMPNLSLKNRLFMAPSVAADIGGTQRWGLLSRIRRKVRVLTSTQVIKIHTDGVTVRRFNNREENLRADTVVVAAGLRSREELIPFLDRWRIEYYCIGSCQKPGQIIDAISEGFELGCRI